MRVSILAALFLIVGLRALPSQAATLHNTRAIVLDGLANNYGASYIGGGGEPGNGGIQHDSQVADDFTTGNHRTRLQWVKIDFFQVSEDAPGPVDGLLIEIFEHSVITGGPLEAPFFTQVSTTFDVGQFPPGTFLGDAARRTYTVAVDVVLPEGRWWLSVVPMDRSPTGRAFHWVGMTTNLDGRDVHRRAGGLAHGNGLPPHFSSQTSVSTWQRNTGVVPGRPVTLSMQIEAFAASDFNLDNAIGVQDIFDFLNAWFADQLTADFNYDNSVGVQDIFDFLAAWFSGS